MAYLITSDYLPQIQSGQLTQLVTTNNGIRAITENRAIAEVKSHLVQKYLTDTEFTDTAQWSNAATYYAANRIYLDATAYSALSTYALGALVLQAGNVYRCSTAIVTPEAFTVGKWTLINAQYTIYYAKYPNPLFSLYGVYVIGDVVYYEGKTYTCKTATQGITQQSAIQYQTSSELPQVNIPPTGSSSSAQYWTELATYTVPAGTLPTDTTYWTLGDNRNQQILGYTIDIVLYYLHARVAPQNIPQLRMDNYDVAREMLREMAKGGVTLDMLKIQPKQGNRVLWGSNIKNINSY